ncbi:MULTISPECIES: hypothetical protein [unclassified Streptomyces]|uniref:hypothetical protein n=2 Tax=Streptomyces TaxID=1883 RepID=UPI002E331B65|nr:MULTISPECIES: hypothetical protein [unclassified Streptomyces]WUC65175.1 hypothetical protein OG861_13490 [Streptomyces sp. NBC_00539]
MMDKAFRNLATGCIAAVSTAAILLAAAGPSAAYGKDGILEVDEFGLFYNQYQSGCVFDLYGEDLNFNDNYFKSGCTGGTSLVNDNTESYKNRDVYAWKVATDANMDGNVGEIPSNYQGNASSTFKNTISSSTYTLHA